MSMNKVYVVFLFAVVSFLASNVRAQGDFSIHVGPAIPVSDFASDDLDDAGAGLAGIGINLGAKYVHPVSTFGLGLFVGADFCYNGLQNDVKDDFEEGFGSQTDITFSKYINIPLTAGLNYNFVEDENLALFLNAGIAVNFLKMTDMVIEDDFDKLTMSTDLANSIGFKIGAGVKFQNNIVISGNYFGLGEHDIDGTATLNGEDGSIDGEQNISIVTFTLGYQF